MRKNETSSKKIPVPRNSEWISSILEQGIYPQVLFRRRLEEEISRARRTRGLLALAIFRDNKPATINALRENVRPMDILGRWENMAALLLPEAVMVDSGKGWSDRVHQISRTFLRLAGAGAGTNTPIQFGVCLLPEKRNGKIIGQALLNGALEAVKVATKEQQSVIYKGNERLLEIIETSEPTTIIRTGDIHVDRDHLSVGIGSDVISLRRKEFDLLVYLVKNIGKIVSRDSISRAVWDAEFYNTSRTIDLHIAQVRKLLRQSKKLRIHTVKGVGYRLERSA